MLNIVIPMAGAGSRFASAGYVLPKPLIEVHGQPMIRVVIENLRPSVAHRFVFLAQEAHIQAFDLRRKLVAWAGPGSLVVPVQGLTEGAACTVLLAAGHIDNADPLMVANSDQYVDIRIDDYLAAMGEADGLVMTMPASDPKWSFVGRDAAGRVNHIVEKEVISNEATVGIYNFRRGQAFVQAARTMMAKGLRVNGEFYVAPVYNELIDAGAHIETCGIGQRMHGLGIPQDLDAFLANPLSHVAARRCQ